MSTPPASRPVRAECPDCGKVFGVRAKPGTALTCPACSAPFVLRTKAPAPVPAPAPAPSPAAAPRARVDAPAPEGAEQGPEVPWLRVFLTVLALLVAHVGVYQLLTSSDRSEMGTIEAAYDGRIPTKKPSIGNAPRVGTPEYRTWLEAVQTNKDAERYDELSGTVRVTRSWLTLAFVIQIGLLAFALFRTANKIKQRARLAARARR